MANRPCANCGDLMYGADPRRKTCSNPCRVALQRKTRAVPAGDNEGWPSHFAKQVSRVPQEKRWRVRDWLLEHPDEAARVVPTNVDLDLVPLSPSELLEAVGDLSMLPHYGYETEEAYSSVLDQILDDNEDD